MNKDVTMKLLTLSLLAATLSCSLAFAGERTMTQGQVVFDQGQYWVNGESLDGLTMQEFRKYEGKIVKMAVEKKANGRLDVYKIFVQTPNGFSSDYDWDVVNQERYSN
jgi:hypothetical protein